MLSKKNAAFTLGELTRNLEIELRGDPDCLIYRIRPIQNAMAGDITFLTNPHYRQYLQHTQASAVILNAKDASDWGGNAIVTPFPYYIYAQIASFFVSESTVKHGIHPTVIIGKNCQVHESAVIEANSVIGDNVCIGADVIIKAGCVVDDNVAIGDKTLLDPRVTVYHDVKIGSRCRIASGVVLGSDGFGFANHANTWHKIPQLGSVLIGDDVDIGANTTIDRGALEDTIVDDGVKLDNLIQIGHNVHIGAHTLIAGCVAIAGSTTIGKNCIIGGASCFAGHITISDNVIITGLTAVTKSIASPGIYSSGIVGAVPNHEFRKNNARFHRLENLMQRVKDLERDLKSKLTTNSISA